MMTEKRMNSKLNNVPGGVSTGGLRILARIMAKHHLIQLGAEQHVPSSVPRGQAGGHTTEEEINESADKDLDS